MPDPNEKQAGADNMFGENPNIVVPEVKKEEEKKFDNIPEDHPTIVSLKKEIESIKSEYGGNLVGQRQKIQSLETKIKEYEANGGKPLEKEADPNLPYPEIKFSKDLPEKERELLSDQEIKTMDELATIKERENKKYLDEKNKIIETKEKEVEDLQSLIKNTALQLANNDSSKANEIIESAKQFSYQGLSEEQIKQRVENAFKLLPTYTPPKEVDKKLGGAIKDNNGSGSDEFSSNDKIIEEASKGSNGGYQL